MLRQFLIWLSKYDKAGPSGGREFLHAPDRAGRRVTFTEQHPVGRTGSTDHGSGEPRRHEEIQSPRLPFKAPGFPSKPPASLQSPRLPFKAPGFPSKSPASLQSPPTLFGWSPSCPSTTRRVPAGGACGAPDAPDGVPGGPRLRRGRTGGKATNGANGTGAGVPRVPSFLRAPDQTGCRTRLSSTPGDDTGPRWWSQRGAG